MYRFFLSFQSKLLRFVISILLYGILIILLLRKQSCLFTYLINTLDIYLRSERINYWYPNKFPRSENLSARILMYSTKWHIDIQTKQTKKKNTFGIKGVFTQGIYNLELDE